MIMTCAFFFKQIFGDSFSATALFLLGLRMVDCTVYFKGPDILTPIILTLMKQ